MAGNDCRLESELQTLQTQATALRARQGAFTSISGRGAAQVEMLNGLQSLLTLKLNMHQDLPTEAKFSSAPQGRFSGGVAAMGPRPYSMSETNVMTL